ncbi:MAG: hypothetical protein HRU11_03660 [Parvularculaceae bacterium]|nr:hypothetical protein [Parvularculaceae bacterium]
MATGLAVGLLALALVFWIEAHERRAVLAPIQASPQLRMLGKAVGWVLASSALIVLAQTQGWERGIPVWLAWFSTVAAACLVFAARFTGKHWWVGSAGLVACFIFGALHLLGGVL